MKGSYLGEFEEIVMLAVGSLYNEAYGNAIKEEVETKSGRGVNLSAIHSALYRLERKGFLQSRKGEPTGERGGKRKKYFTITAFGINALQEAENLRSNLRTSIPDVVWQLKAT